MSAVDARVARIAAWWRERQPRERAMLGVMAVLVAAFVYVYGLLLPLRQARDTAQLRQQDAATALADARANAASLATLDSTMPVPPADAATLRTAVLDGAARAGLGITRESTGDDGSLVIEVETATAGQLLGFLDALRQRYGLAPTTLSAAATDGQLRVQAAFVPAP
ncbi:MULTISPECIES: type II secretion system protein GspM [Luteimonas]|uniref:type II secretion system protein GspM n=1 Tax=Luteimonas TaxID=83614 RepID=UPI000C7CAEE5|nr:MULTISPECIES: type II secretion system protein GspM [Luteimonas]